MGLKERSLWSAGSVVKPAVLGHGRPDRHVRGHGMGSAGRIRVRPITFTTSRETSPLSGIMAIGMTAVILTGGIDLSVWIDHGLVGVICGLVLQAEGHWAMAISAGLRQALLRAR